jgi:hypothetical protein
MKKNIACEILIISLFVPGLATACPDNLSRSPADGVGFTKESLLCEGLLSFYNGDYAAANMAFDRYIAIAPDDPAGLWRKLMNRYFQLRNERKNDAPSLTPEEYQNLTAIANAGITKAETKIARGEQVDFNRYVESGILSLLSTIQYKTAPLTALGTLRKSIEVAQQSSYPSAGFLLGFVNYEASRHFIARLVLPSDRKKGLAMIFAAAAQKSIFADDVWFVIFEIEKDPTNRYQKSEAENVWRYLYAKYPKNPALKKFQAGR